MAISSPLKGFAVADELAFCLGAVEASLSSLAAALTTLQHINKALHRGNAGEALPRLGRIKSVPYSATIIEVMIASPGDVVNERQTVREILNDWNVVHGRNRKAMLVLVGWETHSAPDLGARAQQMINDRLLAHCDLLIGIF